MNKIPRKLKKSVEISIADMYERTDFLLTKAKRARMSVNRKKHQANADAIIQEFYEWFDDYHNDEFPSGLICVKVTDL